MSAMQSTAAATAARALRESEQVPAKPGDVSPNHLKTGINYPNSINKLPYGSNDKITKNRTQPERPTTNPEFVPSERTSSSSFKPPNIKHPKAKETKSPEAPPGGLFDYIRTPVKYITSVFYHAPNQGPEKPKTRSPSVGEGSRYMKVNNLIKAADGTVKKVESSPKPTPKNTSHTPADKPLPDPVRSQSMPFKADSLTNRHSGATSYKPSDHRSKVPSKPIVPPGSPKSIELAALSANSIKIAPSNKISYRVTSKAKEAAQPKPKKDPRKIFKYDMNRSPKLTSSTNTVYRRKVSTPVMQTSTTVTPATVPTPTILANENIENKDDNNSAPRQILPPTILKQGPLPKEVSDKGKRSEKCKKATVEKDTPDKSNSANTETTAPLAPPPIVSLAKNPSDEADAKPLDESKDENTPILPTVLADLTADNNSPDLKSNLFLGVSKLTSGGKKTAGDKISPINKQIPSKLNNSGRKSPKLASSKRSSPSAGRKSPSAGRKSPSAGRKSPSAGRKSPSAVRKSPSATRKPSPVANKKASQVKKSPITAAPQPVQRNTQLQQPPPVQQIPAKLQQPPPVQQIPTKLPTPEKTSPAPVTSHNSPLSTAPRKKSPLVAKQSPPITSAPKKIPLSGKLSPSIQSPEKPVKTVQKSAPKPPSPVQDLVVRSPPRSSFAKQKQSFVPDGNVFRRPKEKKTESEQSPVSNAKTATTIVAAAAAATAAATATAATVASAALKSSPEEKLWLQSPKSSPSRPKSPVRPKSPAHETEDSPKKKSWFSQILTKSPPKNPEDESGDVEGQRLSSVKEFSSPQLSNPRHVSSREKLGSSEQRTPTSHRSPVKTSNNDSTLQSDIDKFSALDQFSGNPFHYASAATMMGEFP